MGTAIELGQLQDALKATFLTAMQEHQTTLQQEPAPGDDSKALVKAEDPKMGQGFIDTIDDFRVPVLNVKLPWASAVLGISAGTIVGNAIDVAMPPKNEKGQDNLVNPALQLAAAGLEVKFLPGNLGKFAAGAHIVKLALRYTPLAEWLLKIEQALSQPFQEKKEEKKAAPAANTQQDAFQNYQGYRNYTPAPGFTNASPAWN